MKRAKISQLKNSLSRYLDYVRDGGVVRIFDRDRPIADLVPVGHASSPAATPLDEILDELERKGIVRRGTGKVPAGFLNRKLPKARKSVVDALLEERREGR